MKRIFSKIRDDIQIDIIAISKINNGCEKVINFFKEQKVKILLRD
jgi:hypothetical protein